jgi:hypothetical protein
MNLNNKVGHLLDSGLSPKLVSSLSESQIDSLYKRLVEGKKKDTNEATVQNVKQAVMSKSEFENLSKTTGVSGMVKQNTDGSYTVTQNESEIKEDEFYTDISGTDQDPIQKSGPDYPGSNRSGLDEKFESKAQQGLFWARCNKCKSENCKWCKMAKEFSKSTSKKQYKDMPKKKHPEKTIKYKKKETKEGYLENVGKKITDTYAKKAFHEFKPGLQWGGFSESLDNVIEKYTEPTMKKIDLLRLIEATMGDTKEKTKETEIEKEEKKKTGFPFRKPREKEAPEAETETETKPETKPKTKPDKGSPFQRPKPNEDPAEAKNKNRKKGEQKEGLDYFMSQVKKSGLI